MEDRIGAKGKEKSRMSNELKKKQVRFQSPEERKIVLNTINKFSNRDKFHDNQNTDPRAKKGHAYTY